MTDNKLKITPPPHLMLTWQEEARDEVRDDANHFDRQSIQMIKAATWGWQQRDASVATELQEARDAELEACCAVTHALYGHYQADWLRSMRRPKSKSQAEEALNALDDAMIKGHSITTSIAAPTIRAALERLRELEGDNG